MTTAKRRAAAWGTAATMVLLAASGLVQKAWRDRAMAHGNAGRSHDEALHYPAPAGQLRARLEAAWQQVRAWPTELTETPAMRGRLAARAFRDAKDNAFFVPTDFTQTTLRHQPQVVAELTAYLADRAPLAGVNHDEDFSRSRPPILTERMAAIDLLQAYADAPETRQVALAGLHEIFELPLPVEVPTKGLAFAEKYDVLAALARVDSSGAFAAYTALENSKMADLLGDALVVGLVDTGVPRREALELVRQSRHSD